MSKREKAIRAMAADCAEEIARRGGWWRGGEDNIQSGACAWTVACNRGDDHFGIEAELRARIMRALGVKSSYGVFVWNDSRGRRKRDVVNLFRRISRGADL